MRWPFLCHRSDVRIIYMLYAIEICFMCYVSACKCMKMNKRKNSFLACGGLAYSNRITRWGRSGQCVNKR